MSDQPNIVNSDLSELQVFNGVFDDRTVTVAAGEVLAKNTVLAFDTVTGKTVICESDGADYPRSILMQELDNSGGGVDTDFDNVRVMIEGEFDASQVVFDNGTDTVDTLGDTTGVSMRDAMKTEGLIARNLFVLDGLDNQ